MNKAPTRADLFAVIRAAADYFRVGEAHVLGYNKTPLPTRARRAAMMIIREQWGLSYPELGRLFKRDHTSVIAAIRKGGDDVAISADVRALILDSIMTIKQCCPTCGQQIDRAALVSEIRAELLRLSARLDSLARG